jgi:hypothetical protein
MHDQLKHVNQIKYARYRSLTGFMVHVVSELMVIHFHPESRRWACGTQIKGACGGATLSKAERMGSNDDGPNGKKSQA